MITNTLHKSLEGSVTVCCHNVSFRYTLPRPITNQEKAFLVQEAEDRARSQIIEEYNQGELNYESEDLSCTGWWRI